MDDTKWKDGKRIGKNGDLEVRKWETSLIGKKVDDNLSTVRSATCW